MLGRRTTGPSSGADATTRGSSRAASATNHASANNGGSSTTGGISAGHGQDSRVSSAGPASPTQERENATETEVEQRVAAQERGLASLAESLASRAAGSQQMVSSGEPNA